MIPTWMKLALAIIVGLISSTYQQGAPPAAPEPYSEDDPRCKAWNTDADTRDFELIGIEVKSSGCYDLIIDVNDEGYFNGTIRNKCVLEPACPVSITLLKENEQEYKPVAACQENLQGSIDKFASVVANIACCSSEVIELPRKVKKEPIIMNPCLIFARHFPAGFPAGKYRVEIKQNCAEAFGEGYDGTIIVDLELQPK